MKKSTLILLASGLVVLVLVIIILMVAGKKPGPAFVVSPEESLSALADSSQQVPVGRLKEKLEKGAVLIDLRDPYSFARGHHPQANCIPMKKLLSEASMELFSQAKEGGRDIIFYGNEIREGSSVAFLLTQMGFSNARYLAEGLPGLFPNPADSLSNLSRDSEDPVADFALAMKAKTPQIGDKPQVKKSTGETVKLAPVAKPAAAEGGC